VVVAARKVSNIFLGGETWREENIKNLATVQNKKKRTRNKGA